MAELPKLLATVVAWLHEVAPFAQLSSDSRRIEVGDVFFAYPGDGADRRLFIGEAVANGAAAVIFDPEGFDWDPILQVPHRALPNLQQRAGMVANAFYQQPEAGMFVAAVTGTNGKTSCSQWLAAALSTLGEVVGVIGTLGIGVYRNGHCGELDVTGYTTPDAVQLQRELAQLRAVGVTTLAIEASSIGLAQGRMNGMRIDAALFTNLSRDHLDYHHDMASYESAKNILFDWPELHHAILNLDDRMGQRLVTRCKNRVPPVSVTTYAVELEVGINESGFPAATTLLSAHVVRGTTNGTQFQLQTPFGQWSVKTQLVGRFNVSNVLGVLGLLLARGIEPQAAVSTLSALVSVPGRMQKIQHKDAPLVIIDYAHTPDAIIKVLTALRSVADERAGKLWCVFGCGGDRDHGKRPQMGAASMAADYIVCTNDNPRTENPAAIIADILVGITLDAKTDQRLRVIEDRAAAILWAVKHAAKADVILLAGKGHEPYQEVGTQKFPFLDADHAVLALTQLITVKEMN